MNLVPPLLRLFSAVALLIASCFTASAAETRSSTNSGTTLVVETRDGSRLVGQLTAPTLEFESAVIGRLQVDLGRLVEMRRTPVQTAMTLTMINGDRLTGELVLPSLRLRTAFGEIGVPREQIVMAGVRRSLSSDGLRHLWSAEGDARDAVGDAHGQASGVIRYVEGRRGRAFAFGAEAEGIRLGESAGNFGVGDFTVAFWIRTTARPQIEYVMSKREACQPVKLWEVRRESDGRIALALGDVKDEFVPAHLFSRSRVDDSAWHHVAFTRQRESVSVFVDGQHENKEQTPFIFNYTIPVPLRLGSGCCAGQGGTTHFAGQLDEVALYDRALSAAEIQALFGNH